MQVIGTGIGSSKSYLPKKEGLSALAAKLCHVSFSCYKLSLASRPNICGTGLRRTFVGSIMSVTSDIFDVNPYETHASLTPLEANVLWEYAKLSQHVKDVGPILSQCSSGHNPDLMMMTVDRYHETVV